MQDKIKKVKKQTEKQNLLAHQPLSDWVLLAPIEFDNPDVVYDAPDPERKPEWGYVLGVGPGRVTEQGELVKIDVKDGDVVLFMAYGATKVKVLGQDYIYVRAEDLISKHNS